MRPNLCGSASVRSSRKLISTGWPDWACRRAAFLALLALVSFGVAAPVMAEAFPKLEPVAVAVIDFRGVLSQSEAAKGIRKIIDTRREEFRSQFAQIEKQLREEQQALAQQRPIITADAFEQRAQNLQGRVRQAQLEAQRSNQQLKRALDKAMDTVQKSLFRVVAELAEESGAGVVLFRNSIVIAVKNLEISREALKRLNSSLSKVEVIFEPAEK